MKEKSGEKNYEKNQKLSDYAIVLFTVSGNQCHAGFSQLSKLNKKSISIMLKHFRKQEIKTKGKLAWTSSKRV